MRSSRATTGIIIGMTLGFIAPIRLQAETVWSVDSGSTLISLDLERLDQADLKVHFSTDQPKSDRQALLFVSNNSTLTLAEQDGRLARESDGAIFHTGGIVMNGPAGSIRLEPLRLQPAGAGVNARYVVATETGVMLELRDAKVGFDRASGMLLVEAAELVITDELAQALGDASLAGMSIGALTARANLQWTDGDIPPTDEELYDQAAAGGLRTTCGNTGADVIVGSLSGVTNYSSVGGTEAFAVGTDSCNIGDVPLNWIASENQHPVIAQNMYRLKDDRFEQIGLSWLKHGFTALANDLCGCGCTNPGTGALLGVGCSDPYSSGLNGTQSYLGPRFEVNAHTGYYPYPFTGKDQTGDSIYKRVQVAISDLDPAQDGGGLYFAEGQYVTPDDAAAGNQDNNSSWRQISISGSGTSWDGSVDGMPETVREAPAIKAWKANDPSVVETEVRVPDEGLVMVSAKATDLGGGQYHYEYAVQNLNSDRSIGAFRVPIVPTATVTNIGFHDVNYHSGEPFDGTDWAGVHSGSFVTWSTEDFAVNPDANALRWGTLYNFRFDADVAPQTTIVQMELFKPGSPARAYALTTGPQRDAPDCNSNGVPDNTDIATGAVQDCNGNKVPDECEGYTEPVLKAVEFVTGLASPVGLVAAPSVFDQLFVLEQNTGRIRVIREGTLLATPFLDLGSLISSGGERGLLGLAFHPKYLTNGYFYVDYTNTAGNTVIARYKVTSNPDIADPSSAVILKTITQDFANHNGGQLAFGPDGNLYVALGDGGSGGDPNARAQDLNVLLGKILRLDVDAGAPYIPNDNPFVGTDGLDEIWAYGVRNPWRFSFDRLTGDLYIADVGQGAWEEIDFQPADSVGGENYGWRCYEGDAEYNTTGCADPGTMVFPILTYDHSGGACSITGGFVYRGCAMPGLHGTYFYADYCADFVRSFRYQPGDAIPPTWQDRTAELGPFDGAIVSFGQDSDGELYIVSSGGTIYKIVPDTDTTECGNGILETGEQCDDGNTTDGDGCSAICEIETGENDQCAGATDVCAGIFTGDTSTATNDGSASCASSSTTNDRWYRYSPALSGNATFSLCTGTSYDAAISVHTECTGTSANELACDDDGCGTVGGPATVTISVTAGESYLIRVSGYNGNSGTYTLQIDGPECLLADCNANGIDDFAELAGGTAQDCNSNTVPDDCDIAAGTSTDCDGGPVGIPAGGQLIVSTSCFGCHNNDGSGGPGYPGPNLRGRTRVFIWNKLTPPTDHPGGAHPEFSQQDYANLEAFLSDVGGRSRPDLIPDECQVTPDCNTNGIPDGCDLDSGLAVDYDHSGVLDICEEFCPTTLGDGDGDCDVDLADFAQVQRCFTGNVGTGPVVYATGCGCLDSDADGDVDGADYDAFASELYGPGDTAPGCP